VRALAAAHPEDAELQYTLGGQLNIAGRIQEAANANRQALKLDPKYMAAWAALLADQAYLGEHAAVVRDAQACMATSPSLGCLVDLGLLQSDLGDAKGLEQTARQELAIAPQGVNGFEDLACAEACTGASLATLRHTFEQRVAGTDEPHRDEMRANGEIWLAWMQGDFETLLRLQAEERGSLATATDVARHAASAYGNTRALLELGKRSEALAAGRAYLELRPSLTGVGDDADDALGGEWFGLIWRNLREAGASRDEMHRARDAFVASWRPRLGPDYQPFLWTIAYLETTEDADEAREALEELPHFGGLMKRWNILPAEAFLGHLYLLLDRVDEAIPWLERGAHACREPFSIRPIEASFWLGEAWAKKGEKANACDAYAHVLKRWGNAKPKSVTADEAKKRSKALGCGG
jgi:serine/threonine-protein kinase